MNIYSVVAASDNDVIGVGSDIPWHLPNDFKHFKATTLDNYILMGRKTWETFVKPLPRRKHLVISTQLSPEDMPKDVLLFSSITNALQYLEENNVADLYVIGGGEIYKQLMPQVKGIYLTRVHTHIEGGTAFFPKFSKKDWELKSSEHNESDNKHNYAYTFEYWERK